MALRLRRGTDAERTLITPLEGELLYVTDTKRLYIGDGLTPGGVAVLDATNTGITLGNLADVNLTDDSTIPANGEVLSYDASNDRWVPVAIDSVIGSLNDLGDVDLTTPATDGQVLKFDIVSGKFIPANDIDTTLIKLTDLSDVDTQSTVPLNGQILRWDAGSDRWVPDNLTVEEGGITRIEQLENVALISPQARDQLYYDAVNGVFYNDREATAGAQELSDLTDIAIITPQSGDIIVYDAVGGAFYNTQPAATTLESEASPRLGGNLDTQGNAIFGGGDGIFGILTADQINVGSITADVTGSIFADNSTLLVDSVNGTIPGQNISGDLVGPSRLGIVNDFSYRDVVRFTNYGNDGNGLYVNISKSRGTIAAPADLQAGDEIGRINFADAFTGGVGAGAAAIVAKVDPDGTPAPGIAPGMLEFVTMNNAGSAIVRAEIDSNGILKTYGPHIGVSTAPTGIPFYSLNYSNISSEGPRLLMRRSRGTESAPTAVSSGDSLHRITFGAYDGSSFIDTAFIKASVEGAVSTGVVPTKIEIRTSDSTGTVNTPLTIGTENNVSANKLSVSTSFKLPIYADSTARDTDIASPEPGMMVFLTGTSKAQVNTDGTTGGWVDLH